jgi:hypothetical protein
MMLPPPAAAAVALDPAPQRPAPPQAEPEALDPITAAALAALGLVHMPRHQRGLDAACSRVATLETWGWDQVRAWQYLRARVPTWNEWRAAQPEAPPAPQRKGPPERPKRRAPAPQPTASDSA